MQKEQIKTLVVNITTGAVIVGVIIVGYFAFTKKDTIVISSDASVASVAEKTAFIGVEIESSIFDLKELSGAIARSKIFFDLPEFKNLENFSVVVPSQTVGRDNPFVPAEWKVKMNAQLKPVGNSATQQNNTQSSTLPEGLLGDFETDI